MSAPEPDRFAEALERHRAGDADAAERLLTDLVRDEPTHASAHRLLAHIAAASGRTAPALDHLRAAVSIQPASADLRFEWGCLLGYAGDHAAAVEAFRTTTRLRPGHAEAWRLLGVTLATMRRDAEAAAALRQARSLAPRSRAVLQALADVEFRSGFPADALPLWEALWHDRPDDETATLRLGETYSRLGRDDDAVAHFRAAVARDPASPGLWVALAQAFEDAGERDESAAAYRSALAVRPGWPVAIAGLLGLGGDAATAADEAAAEAARSASLDDAARATLGYALGKRHDAKGDYLQAMACWDDANAARRRMIGPYDDSAIRRRGDAIVDGYPAEAFASRRRGAASDDRPIFVVGMPRSGTTLTEQILAAHPQAFGCGELAELGLIATHLPLPDGTPRAWLPAAADIGDEALAWGAARWLEAATRLAPPQARRLVDKSPLNFQLLGLAALMFPDARVVWCRRDPRDVAVSIYGENFSLDERFATAMEGIAGFVNLMNRLMRHWQRVTPLPILEFEYESLVGDPEGQARRLVEFAGLPWDPACLAFHGRRRGVQTPSRWQVRQPVHGQSVARWRNYAFALAPLLGSLDEPPAS